MLHTCLKVLLKYGQQKDFYLEGRGDNAQISWAEFVKKFYEKYFTERFRDKQAENFEEVV